MLYICENNSVQKPVRFIACSCLKVTWGLGMGIFFLWARSKSFSSRLGISEKGTFLKIIIFLFPGLWNPKNAMRYSEKNEQKSLIILVIWRYFGHWPLDEAASYKSHAFWWSSQGEKEEKMILCSFWQTY